MGASGASVPGTVVILGRADNKEWVFLGMVRPELLRGG